MAEERTPFNEAAADEAAAAERLAAILAYHEESKHRYDRMAPSLGYMDWANQPEPFRHYRDCETIRLPLAGEDPPLAYEALFTPPEAPPAPVTRGTLGRVLELSLGLSAWKVSGANRWALRMVPSSGNLHPTEAYLIVSGAEDLASGIYHYTPLLHALERLLEAGPDLKAPFRQAFPGPGVWIAFTSIFWREAWKYGLRAYRYCQLDMGHALAGLSLAARLANWRCRLVHGVAIKDLDALLGLDRHQLPAAERERTEALCWLGQGLPPQEALSAVNARLPGAPFRGVPNRLSQAHEHWKAIDRIAGLVVADPLHGPPECELQWPSTEARATGRAATVIRRRRSAAAYDPRREMPRADFLAIVGRTLPRMAAPPFALRLTAPAIHLVIFLHRVAGLRRGLYALCRQPAHLDRLRTACTPAFLWEAADTELPLYLLKPGDFVYEAIQISCDQAIAGHSAFSLGMLAEFHPRLKHRPEAYRPLLWEAGQVGHLLYLEAEARGFRGTGIGCFFDDGMHNLLGLRDREFQSLYHFTVGTPLVDTRLETLPAYHHRQGPD